jgi:hypothetical protein
MAATSSSPLSSSSLSPHRSPYGRVTRRSPLVQALQSAPSYVDIYTGSPLGQALNLKIQSQSSVQAQSSGQSQSQPVSHAHPDPPPRWQGPRGFGARHINDRAPFSLWNEEKQDFRSATTQEKRSILETYNAERLEFHDYHIVIETSNPPRPVPLTVACTPAIFVPPGQGRKHMSGSAPYVGPRVRDPCPNVSWGRMQTPKISQMTDVISVLMQLVDIKRVSFLPTSIVVELVYGDGRVYTNGSLPAVVAGLTTSYHHDSVPFFNSMKDHTRERLLDPGRYLPGPLIGPLPQDGTNYLREPSWRILNPGVRISTGSATSSGTYADTVQSTTCGILLRKGVSKCVSVANHGFLASNEVFHPAANGDKIGDIVNRYPELDIAMVQLTPAHSSHFSNQTYFQAEPPKRLADTSNLVRGTWFEVDGMSTGMLSFQYLIDSFERPVRPLGHPEIPVLRWKRDIAFRIFGASSPQLMDGLCGAPFVEVETGNVAGFFHLANGDWAECAALDDFVTEGWEIA